MSSAIGMLETYGLLPAIEGLDAALKAANVTLRSFDYVSGGYIAWFVQGDVGSVRVAVSAGKAAASKLGKVISDHVIPRPATGVADSLPPPGRPGGRKTGTGIHRRDFPARRGERDHSKPKLQSESTGQSNMSAGSASAEPAGPADPAGLAKPAGPAGAGSPAKATRARRKGAGGTSGAAGSAAAYSREELEAMNVHAVRAIARLTGGVPMSRIEIRDAKKAALIDGIMSAQGKAGR